MKIPRRGLCLVIAAPSGGGKSSITRALLELEPDLCRSVSVTTREPRPGEREGVDYYFQDRASFERSVQFGAFLEWAQVFGNFYGTPRAPVEEALAAGCDVAFDIDWQGFRALRDALPGDVVGVFLLPPALHALEKRLHQRRGDDPAEIARRMRAARDEMSHWREFDYVIVNEDLDRAASDVRGILGAARLEARRQFGLRDFVHKLSE
ncbi:MAG: guanylate kinase [Acetobacteraceae bacterium]|nr:guanylate kinase [Acetobacteraceae bacterium]